MADGLTASDVVALREIHGYNEKGTLLFGSILLIIFITFSDSWRQYVSSRQILPIWSVKESDIGVYTFYRMTIMNQSIASPVLAALFLCSVVISGCGLAGYGKPVPLSGSGLNAQPASTPPPPNTKFPTSNGFVNDFAGVLSVNESDKLESALRELQRRGKIDLSIAIVKTTGGKDIFDYSLEMAKAWRIGSDNGGALLVVATEDRKWRIQIDKKLEKKFSDAEIKSIGDRMVPHFKELKYDDGVKAGVKAFLDELAHRNSFDPIDL